MAEPAPPCLRPHPRWRPWMRDYRSKDAREVPLAAPGERAARHLRAACADGEGQAHGIYTGEMETNMTFPTPKIAVSSASIP
ncbi:unnamed protein product [Miscanthus lutarioriparius]|uniref:Uncharacterized protein n=1 Tax=Miscanthus lutarioriparius TaxID=422564 RepID=A0A811SDH9_9POAL|nr:unnamed protein product [Miscanthus lutarioriparius]